METHILKRFSAAAQIVTGILLVVWWLLMGTLLPVGEAATDFARMIVHPGWVPANIVGMAACIAWVFSLPVHSVSQNGRTSVMRLAAVATAGTGAVWFACIQYYETFLWPVVAATNPELVQLKGALVSGSTLVAIPLILSGLTVAAGYILLFIAHKRSGDPHTGVILLRTIGALVFANGVVIPVRTVGMLLFATAMIRHGMLIIRKNMISDSGNRETGL